MCVNVGGLAQSWSGVRRCFGIRFSLFTLILFTRLLLLLFYVPSKILLLPLQCRDIRDKACSFGRSGCANLLHGWKWCSLIPLSCFIFITSHAFFRSTNQLWIFCCACVTRPCWERGWARTWLNNRRRVWLCFKLTRKRSEQRKFIIIRTNKQQRNYFTDVCGWLHLIPFPPKHKPKYLVQVHGTCY